MDFAAVGQTVAVCIRIVRVGTINVNLIAVGQAIVIGIGCVEIGASAGRLQRRRVASACAGGRSLELERTQNIS